jgi:outer membrane lipoprotein carrier protein
MRVIGLTILACFTVINLFGQNDPQAKAILDKVASKNNSYKTIKTDFKFTTTSIQNEPVNTESGTILIKGDKYHLTLSNSDVVFDGKSIYTYLNKENEINITKPEPSRKENGDFFFTNPRDIFKIYSKNFKAKLIKEITIGSILYYEIDLYPIDLKTKYTRIRMHINKSNMQILDLKIFLKEGTQQYMEFSNFLPDTTISDNEFTFDSKKYPNAEVNDMRF